MLQIPEAKLVSPRINANRELVFTIRVKQEDYTQEAWNIICDLVDAGTPMAIVMQEFQSDEPQTRDPKPFKLKTLGYLMEKYAEKYDYDLDILKEKLYRTHHVKSRRDLTEEQLNEAIQSYLVGLDWD